MKIYQFLILLLFISCAVDEIEEQEKEQSIVVETIKFENFQNRKELKLISNELKSLNDDLLNKNFENKNQELANLSLDLDNIKYVKTILTHTYNIPVSSNNKNVIYNIGIRFNSENSEYNSYFIKYKFSRADLKNNNTEKINTRNPTFKFKS
ncbi:hypothetical protein [Gramella sp. AN32]|uniref:Lipoprotein n=1 Tax=Christiangramia antarctica TaxID=2058158 RepID=A0ABW5X548_9FLAO|nr:hypothetical protein [Gramella sp. AN32]MCM4157888.1 hypothetical protein [Gramella sp. AN32]